VARTAQPDDAGQILVQRHQCLDADLCGGGAFAQHHRLQLAQIAHTGFCQNRAAGHHQRATVARRLAQEGRKIAQRREVGGDDHLCNTRNIQRRAGVQPGQNRMGPV